MIQPAFKQDYQEITELWEASVRATHHFLSEADIAYFKSLLHNEYLGLVELFCIKDDDKRITGFLGIADHKIEMLFIHPGDRGKGFGKQLLNFAVNEKNSTKVDVNEQNGQAVGFYTHYGFEVVSRSPVDALGKPFPILSMKLKERAICKPAAAQTALQRIL